MGELGSGARCQGHGPCFSGGNPEAYAQNQMFLKLVNGSTIQVLGSDNYNSLMGTNYFGLVFSEWALSDPESWAYLRPILSQNKGWALFITTPRGKNHAYDMLQAAKSEPNWFTTLSTVADTDAIPIEQQATDLREYVKLYGQIQGQAFFRQEFFCDFDSPILGAVYADALGYLESEGRIKRLKSNLVLTSTPDGILVLGTRPQSG